MMSNSTPREINLTFTNIHKNYKNVYSSLIHNSKKLGTTKCLPTGKWINWCISIQWNTTIWKRNKPAMPGWLSQLSTCPQLRSWSQWFWDQVSHRAPCSVGSLFLPLPALPVLPAARPASALSDKYIKSFKGVGEAIHSHNYVEEHKARHKRIHTIWLHLHEMEIQGEKWDIGYRR